MSRVSRARIWAVAVLLVAGAWLVWVPAARAGGADVLLRAGREHLARGEGAAAVEALGRAYGLEPGRADVCYALAKAHEAVGNAQDALSYFLAAKRLDPAGSTGKAAVADAHRLRERWLKVELEAAAESLQATSAMISSGRVPKAWKGLAEARGSFERAFDLARGDEAHADEARQAREGYVRCGALEVAARALEGRQKGTKVRLVPVVRRAGIAALGEMAALVEAEVARSLQLLGAEVLGVRSEAAFSLVVRGEAGQRFLLTAETREGAVLAKLALRALISSGEVDVGPERIALDLSLVAERDDPSGQGRHVRLAVSEGSVLRSMDRIRIRIRVSRDAYVYAILFDSQGRATLLYPGTERLFPALLNAGVRTPNPVPGGQDLLVPPPPPKGKPFWFFLDENTGTETFYVAASVRPLADVEGLLAQIDAAGEAGRVAARKLGERLRRRAAGTRVEAGAKGHLELIRGRGAAVRYISVEHR